MSNYVLVENGVVVQSDRTWKGGKHPLGFKSVPEYVVPGYLFDGTAYTEPAPDAPVSEQINQERDRRIALGFSFNGKTYALDSASKARVTGAATLAGFAIAGGATAGNYRWHGGSSDFVWIADDNTLTSMDAQICFAFGQAAAAWETAHIFACRAIKEISPIPSDYTNNSYWPLLG